MTGHLSVRAVVEAVSAITGVPAADIIGPRRTRTQARARQIAIWCAKHYCPHLSYPQIGRRMGGRDHTTILHSVRRIEAEIEAVGKDAELQAVEQVLMAARSAIERLGITDPDPDPKDIAMRAMDDHAVARLSFAEIRVLAQFALHVIEAGQLVADPPEREPEPPQESLPHSNALLVAARRVVMAHRDLQSARYGRGEVSALNVLAGAVSDLQAAYLDLGYSIATPDAFKPSSNAPRKEAQHG